MIRSMTGFASASGALEGWSWSWELRGVNGKGLDLRLRVPDWVEGLEVALRKQVTGEVARGNITCNLRIASAENDGTLQVNTAQVDTLLAALHEIEARAMDAGVSLAPSRASDILTMRGVLEQSDQAQDIDALREALLAEFPAVLEDFNAMRRQEGAALADVMQDQLNEVETLAAKAAALADARKEDTAANLRRNLARVMNNSEGADADRVAQELALIAVKADVTEEIDRLAAHVAAARALIGQGGPVGRKLDFLMQEFNREANTLCSKAQSTELTTVGLALKAVIDQMREQVQNVE
ncbi:YicC family protein [Sulfitobacter sp. W027]|uniref:YicC/YloC family endoribonuclease n=1 Tax=Sulfitobacter sp. W027 TaxID=2867025 RepID=UPI0021A8C43B|nr:YicC/YloC family endoribonuclease [Sulfitobacter sp. W027]UWR34993.1 YicC family protein [Sulfitobacter sp. W027]